VNVDGRRAGGVTEPGNGSRAASRRSSGGRAIDWDEMGRPIYVKIAIRAPLAVPTHVRPLREERRE
jgi:hypothetical protein